MQLEFELSYTHAHIAVFEAGLSNPFNDSTPEHDAQGFSWRPGSVSFGTLDDCGQIFVTGENADEWIAA